MHQLPGHCPCLQAPMCLHDCICNPPPPTHTRAHILLSIKNLAHLNVCIDLSVSAFMTALLMEYCMYLVVFWLPSLWVCYLATDCTSCQLVLSILNPNVPCMIMYPKWFCPNTVGLMGAHADKCLSSFPWIYN